MMNPSNFFEKCLRRAALLTVSLLLTACVGVGISIPVGPFGSIGLGLNGNGQVSATVGLGGHVGNVGVGGNIALPLGSVAPTTQPNNPQTGSSQNVPRH
jgi:hypothetical protein